MAHLNPSYIGKSQLKRSVYSESKSLPVACATGFKITNTEASCDSKMTSQFLTQSVRECKEQSLAVPTKGKRKRVTIDESSLTLRGKRSSRTRRRPEKYQDLYSQVSQDRGGRSTEEALDSKNTQEIFIKGKAERLQTWKSDTAKHRDLCTFIY